MKKGISIVCLFVGISLSLRGEGYSAGWTPEDQCPAEVDEKSLRELSIAVTAREEAE